MDRLPRAGELYRDVADHVYQIAAVAVHAETGEQMVVYQALFGDFGVYTRSLQQFLGETDYEKYPQAVQQHLFEKMEGSGFRKEAGSSSERLQRSGNQLRSALAEARPGSASEQGTWPAGSASEQKTWPAGSVSEQKTWPAGNTSEQKTWLAGSRTEQNRQLAGNTSEQRPGSAESRAEQRRQPENAAERRQHARPRTKSPAESGRVQRQYAQETPGEGDYYFEKRRRQMEEREQRREMFRKTERHESATEELRANPCLMKFLEAETYEERFQVLNEIREDITDRLIDDIAVVLDVVIPEGELNDRFHQLQNIILTRQKYEISRFR